MRNDCSLSGGWCLKALTRGEYIKSSLSTVLLCNVWWVFASNGSLAGRREGLDVML